MKPCVRSNPQFFIQSGDSVYSDGSILASVTAENGQIWTNRVSPEVSKVAETLNEFRGRYKYNLLDENLPLQCRSFANLAMGRSQSRQQLVGFLGSDE
jgi:phosphodiesterase/alkaline phosphatase D-like protein